MDEKTSSQETDNSQEEEARVLTDRTLSEEAEPTKSEQTEGATSEETDQTAPLEKIKEIKIHFSNLPTYLQKLIRRKETLKTEFQNQKLLNIKVEYMTLCEAIEKEILLQQYRVYRYNKGKSRCYPEERKLYSHIIEYIQQLVVKNHRARLGYHATKELSYKAQCMGIKNTVMLLMHALDERFQNDIAFLLDNQMIIMSG